MDLDRVMGIVFGIMILVTVLLFPFGYLPVVGQTGEQTLLLTVKQIIENIMVAGIEQPLGLLFYEIMLVASFVIMIVAGTLGFYPIRSGMIGILGMIILTFVTVFNPYTGLNIPRYNVGYFIAWGFSIVNIAIGKIQPNMRRKLSTISPKKVPQAPQAVSQPAEQIKPVEAVSEKTVGETSPPADLFRVLSVTEDSEATAKDVEFERLSEPSIPQAPSESPPMELFSVLSAQREYKPPPVIALPSPPVEASVIDEEMSRIRVFLALLEEEKNNNLISEEAYDRLKAKFEKMLEDLDEERRRIIKAR